MAASKKKPDQDDSSKSNSGNVDAGSIEPHPTRDEAGAMQEEGQGAWDSPHSEGFSEYDGTGRESGFEDSLLAGMSPVSNGEGVNSLLHDHELLDQLLTAMVINRTMDTLADGVADRLRYGLARNPQFRRRLIDAVMSNEAARNRFIKTLVKSLV